MSIASPREQRSPSSKNQNRDTHQRTGVLSQCLTIGRRGHPEKKQANVGAMQKESDLWRAGVSSGGDETQKQSLAEGKMLGARRGEPRRAARKG